MQVFQKLADNALTLCFSVFGIWVIWLSHQLGVPEGTELGYNLAIYPRLLGLFIFVASLIIVFREFLKRGIYGGKEAQVLQTFKNAALLKRMGGSVFLVILYLSLISIIGYLLLTPLFLILFIRFLGNKNWMMITMVSLLLTGIIYFFFWILLYIPLPEGIIIGELL